MMQRHFKCTGTSKLTQCGIQNEVWTWYLIGFDRVCLESIIPALQFLIPKEEQATSILASTTCSGMNIERKIETGESNHHNLEKELGNCKVNTRGNPETLSYKNYRRFPSYLFFFPFFIFPCWYYFKRINI